MKEEQKGNLWKRKDWSTMTFAIDQIDNNKIIEQLSSDINYTIVGDGFLDHLNRKKWILINETDFLEIHLTFSKNDNLIIIDILPLIINENEYVLNKYSSEMDDRCDLKCTIENMIYKVKTENTLCHLRHKVFLDNKNS